MDALEERLLDQIVCMAQRDKVQRVLLYGSRARGAHGVKSDIDLAVEGCQDFSAFEEDIQENLDSLLVVDLVNLDTCMSDSLRQSIIQDGKVLYEEVR